MAIQQQTGIPLSKKEIPKGAESPDEMLKYLATNWLDKISKGYKHKKSFNDDAWEARNFLTVERTGSGTIITHLEKVDITAK